MKSKCLVILSGGQDSTTCLYWAKLKFDEIHCLTFDYGQKHRLEVDCARKIASIAEVSSQEVLEIGSLLKGTSPLVNTDKKVEQYESVNDLPGGVEPTFIPSRNILFLTLASNRAAYFGVKDLVTGVCQEDFGGYYDCRQVFINRMQLAISQGVYGRDDAFTIHAPLMNLTKKQSVELASSLEGCMQALAYSHTCYEGLYPPCGKCHACHLRIRGFEQAGVVDPLMKRLEKGNIKP